METASVETVIIPPTRDLGDGFQVRRALPTARRRLVGPFIFFDQMGPALLTAGRGLDVRPHPHIGLATVTYLFDGEILHRDSLGSVQPIRPGEVNWMTAGNGIVHSERTPPELRAADTSLFGIQVWVALPKEHEERAPEFTHHPAGVLPTVDDGGVRMRLIAGSLEGARSPVKTFSEMVYADLQLDAGARYRLTAEHAERAIYVVQGKLEIPSEQCSVDTGQMAVFRPGVEVQLRATDDGPARWMLLGGAPMDGPRQIFWNFVHSSKDRIEQAKEDWRAQRFPKIPEETEFIPLPEAGPANVRYP